MKSPEKELGSAIERGIAAPRAKNAPFGLNTDLFILQEQYSEARVSPQVRKTPTQLSKLYENYRKRLL